MRRLVAMLVLATLAAVPALAGTTYSFQFRVTDGATALKANPKFAMLATTDDQLEKASKDRVMLFERKSGAAWNWLMLSWLENAPGKGQFVNLQGATTVKQADIGVAAGEKGSIVIACLRGECEIAATSASAGKSKQTLQQGGSAEFAVDSRLEITVRLK